MKISDLEVHFLDLGDDGKTMILGCHDLRVFNPMSQLNPNRAQWRKEVNDEFRKLARE